MAKLLMLSVVSAVLVGLLMPSVAGCEFYQYEKEDGSINFTDNPAKIPKKYKKKKKVRGVDEDNPNSSVTNVQINKNRVLVPVTLSFRGREAKANFILDTGAEVSTISPALAGKLNINPQDTDVAFAQGVGGGIHKTGHVKMDYVLVGPNRKYEVDFIVIQSGGNDGLLGMNFLRELRYHVNFDRSTIVWGD